MAAWEDERKVRQSRFRARLAAQSKDLVIDARSEIEDERSSGWRTGLAYATESVKNSRCNYLLKRRRIKASVVD